MTEVDFYILQEDTAQHRAQFACRLADKAFRQGHCVYLHTASAEEAGEIDKLLWSFRQQSFLPHGLLGGEDSERVAIGWQQDPSPHNDVMINLSLQVPEFVGRFQRVAEVVVQQAEIRDSLRSSYKFYKDRGYPLKNNRL